MSICSISVSPKYILLKKGENYLNQTVKVDGDTTTNCLEWSSADPSIAGVHPDSGRILANGVGKTKVYVNSIFDTTKKDYIEVEVTDGAICVQSIELSTTSVTIEKGDTFELSATVSPYNATNKSINWSSSNTNVATVSNGVVTAKAKGWTFIYARANDCSEVEAMCFVEVTEDVLVTSVTVSWSNDEVVLNKNLTVGKVAYASKTVCPCDATNKAVTWSSDDESVAIVNPDSGLVTAKAVGEAKIRATANDGSGVYGECTVTVVPPISVTGIRTCTNKCMEIGGIECLCTTVLPENATNKTVRYCSSNPNVATVELFTGIITSKSAGIATITATTDDGGYTASCEVWVHGKTPVFLIHGRISNSKATWGINNNIPSGKNDDFKSDIDAEALNGEKYIDVDSQTLGVFEPDNGDTDYPCNLGNKLINAGYSKNVNLFAFNYPNQDAVVHSAKKFEKYIENLIDDVRTSGTDEMKACFYASKRDYIEENHKINLVGHSMGGLVARYFIENLYQDNHVDKLITICTPHWGSGYGNFSSLIGTKLHVLCDHDLHFNSAMFGGSNSTTINCDKGTCPESNYIITSALQYQRQRSTKYYAIAGIDCNVEHLNENDHPFEMPTNFTTVQEITDYLINQSVYKIRCIYDDKGRMQIVREVDPLNIGDNVVGFLSQIGWVGDQLLATPEPRIQMEKIYVDVDTNGGNGGGRFIWEMILEGIFDDKILHSKIPHRIPVTEKIIEILGE